MKDTIKNGCGHGHQIEKNDFILITERTLPSCTDPIRIKNKHNKIVRGLIMIEKVKVAGLMK